MALKIKRADEPIEIERINLCIYAPPGVGKTSLGFTADAPLLLDFDEGAYRAPNRKDSVVCQKWFDAAEITGADLEPYKTVVLDTAGRALDKLSADIISKNPKMGHAGALSLKGFGELKVRFAAFLKLLNSFGKDVVLVCHMDEQRNGDDVLERLDAQGSSKGEIYKSVDAMGRIFVRQGKRFLDFSPREGSFGKNPGQLPELEIPHPSVAPRFLADTISLIKEKLNQLSEDQKQAQDEMEEWTTAINDLKDVDEFNRIIPEVKKAPEAVKMYFHGKAKQNGLIFNKSRGLYEAEKVHA